MRPVEVTCPWVKYCPRHHILSLPNSPWQWSWDSQFDIYSLCFHRVQWAGLLELSRGCYSFWIASTGCGMLNFTRELFTELSLSLSMDIYIFILNKEHWDPAWRFVFSFYWNTTIWWFSKPCMSINWPQMAKTLSWGANKSNYCEAYTIVVWKTLNYIWIFPGIDLYVIHTYCLCRNQFI